MKYTITYIIEEDEQLIEKEAEVQANGTGQAWTKFFEDHRGAEAVSIQEEEPSDYSHSNLDE